MKEIDRLKLELDNLRDKNKYNENAYKKRLKVVSESLKVTVLSQKNKKDNMLKLLHEETKILNVCIKKLQKENLNLKNEIKEMSQIIKIPRNHYKYLESSNNLNDIIKQKNLISKQIQLSENPSTLTFDTGLSL